jgi:Ni,Fe-hydrogenase III large subunit
MTDAGELAALLARGTRVTDGAWPRTEVDHETWDAVAEGLAQARWRLVSLWGDGARVHMALGIDAAPSFAVATIAAGDGFPSVARHHLPALRLERTVADLLGLQAENAPDRRPWLDHGKWPLRQPLGARTPAAPLAYSFLGAEGDGLHQIPVGPVHAGIIEPGHFRFTANGETVVRLEERLGYVHKGIDGLMAGAPLDRGARLAGRVSGDSTVAYAYAFARAVEAVTGTDVPPRAVWLRALMAELERIANHLGDIGAICNDASFVLIHTHCAILREKVLRAAASCFGHRLMMDRIVPGGVAADLTGDGVTALRLLVAEIRRTFPELVELYDNTASLQDRTVTTGIVSKDLARQYAAGGYVGRASGRDTDMRRAPGYAPYDALSFAVPVLSEGDVNARVWIRIREVEQSLALIEQIVERLPAGPLRVEIRATQGEGAALVEAFRGDVFVWLRLNADGTIARCHLRDPSWFQWPLLEAAVEGNIVADFPICNKSFNCSYSGHDL